MDDINISHKKKENWRKLKWEKTNLQKCEIIDFFPFFYFVFLLLLLLHTFFLFCCILCCERAGACVFCMSMPPSRTHLGSPLRHTGDKIKYEKKNTHRMVTEKSGIFLGTIGINICQNLMVLTNLLLKRQSKSVSRKTALKQHRRVVIYSVNEKDAVCVICGGTCFRKLKLECVCVCVYVEILGKFMSLCQSF